MATTTMDGTFSLVYLVFNTIMNLTSQDAQAACFGNAARHLEPGGCFVIECRVPELRRLPPGQNVLPWRVSEENWVAYSYDPATQAMHGHYVEFTAGQGEYRTMPFRYVWPSELDLMAHPARPAQHHPGAQLHRLDGSTAAGGPLGELPDRQDAPAPRVPRSGAGAVPALGRRRP